SPSRARAASAPATVAAPDEPRPRPTGMSEPASITRPAGTRQPAPRQAAAKPANSESRSGGTVTAHSVPRRSMRTGAPGDGSRRAVALRRRSIAIPTQSNPAPTFDVEPGTRTSTLAGVIRRSGRPTARLLHGVGGERPVGGVTDRERPADRVRHFGLEPCATALHQPHDRRTAARLRAVQARRGASDEPGVQELPEPLVQLREER